MCGIKSDYDMGAQIMKNYPKCRCGLDSRHILQKKHFRHIFNAARIKWSCFIARIRVMIETGLIPDALKYKLNVFNVSWLNDF